MGAYQSNPLIEAAKSNDLLGAQRLLDHGAIPVDQRDSLGASALHWAANKGHLSVAQALIKKEADLNAADDDGDTPLIFAVGNGHAECMDLLAKAGAKIDAVNHAGKSAMEVAWRNSKNHSLGKDLVRLWTDSGRSEKSLLHSIAENKAAALAVANRASSDSDEQPIHERHEMETHRQLAGMEMEAIKAKTMSEMIIAKMDFEHMKSKNSDALGFSARQSAIESIEQASPMTTLQGLSEKIATRRQKVAIHMQAPDIPGPEAASFVARPAAPSERYGHFMSNPGKEGFRK